MYSECIYTHHLDSKINIIVDLSNPISIHQTHYFLMHFKVSYNISAIHPKTLQHADYNTIQRDWQTQASEESKPNCKKMMSSNWHRFISGPREIDQEIRRQTRGEAVCSGVKNALVERLPKGVGRERRIESHGVKFWGCVHLGGMTDRNVVRQVLSSWHLWKMQVMG